MRANRGLARVLQFFSLRPSSFKAAFADFTSRPNPLDTLLVRTERRSSVHFQGGESKLSRSTQLRWLNRTRGRRKASHGRYLVRLKTNSFA